MSQCSRSKGKRGLGGPIGLPAGAFIQVGTTTRERDGRVLKQVRLRGPDGEPWGPVATEDPMDQMFEATEVKLEPLKMPKTSILFSPPFDFSALSKENNDA